MYNSIADVNFECPHNYYSSNQPQLYDAYHRIVGLELLLGSNWSFSGMFLENCRKIVNFDKLNLEKI